MNKYKYSSATDYFKQIKLAHDEEESSFFDDEDDDHDHSSRRSAIHNYFKNVGEILSCIHQIEDLKINLIRKGQIDKENEEILTSITKKLGDAYKSLASGSFGLNKLMGIPEV